MQPPPFRNEDVSEQTEELALSSLLKKSVAITLNVIQELELNESYLMGIQVPRDILHSS
jgi:hypothetical protein